MPTCYRCILQKQNLDAEEATYEEYTTRAIFMPHDKRKTSMLVMHGHIMRTAANGFVFPISSLAVNRIIPRSSKVFELVEEGRLLELQKMLQRGEASLRDHDENGASLLFVSLP